MILKAREAAPSLTSVAPVAAIIPHQPASLNGLRVLLTDDNMLNRKIIRLLLEPQGCQITEAVHGGDALDKLAALPFDIVLLDAHMPVMDGQETIRQIRASATVWRDIPVIALTADAMTGDREKYLAMGMNEYISKPVDKADLVAKMASCLGSSFSQTQIAI